MKIKKYWSVSGGGQLERPLDPPLILHFNYHYYYPDAVVVSF